MVRLLLAFLCVVFIILPSKYTLSKDFPYADAVTFLATENVAQVLKEVVFCVQIEGDLSNETTADDWISIGTGFFVEGKQKEYVGITCRHVVMAAKNKKKKLFIGIDTEKGYRRFYSIVVHIDDKYDVAIIKPKKKKEEMVKVKNIKFPDQMFDIENKSIVEGRGVLIP